MIMHSDRYHEGDEQLMFSTANLSLKESEEMLRKESRLEIPLPKFSYADETPKINNTYRKRLSDDSEHRGSVCSASTCCSKSISTNLSCSQHHPKKNVRFSPRGNRSKLVESRYDYTPEEFKSLWFTPSEFREIRAHVDETVKMLRAGLTDPERAGYCYRGVEHKVSALAKQRKRNIEAGYEAVLSLSFEDHAFLSCDQDYDDEEECIAKLYHIRTKHCLIEAQQVGSCDARAVQLINNAGGFQTPRMPTRRKYSNAA